MLEQKLEDLLVKKPFFDLTEEEKTYVFKYLTQDQYNQAHFFLKKSVQYFIDNELDMKPANFIEQNLKNAFRSKYQKPSLVLFPNSFKLSNTLLIPAIIVIVCSFFIGYNRNSSSPFQEPNVQRVKIPNPDKAKELETISSTRIIEKNAPRPIQENKRLSNPSSNDQKSERELVQQPKVLNETTMSLQSQNVMNKLMIASFPMENQLYSEENDGELCLTIDIEPLGINEYIEQSSTPGLSVGFTLQDSQIQVMPNYEKNIN